MSVYIPGARIQKVKLVVVPNATSKRNHLGIEGANMIAAQLRRNPTSSISWATGSSPVPVYNEMVRRALPSYRGRGIDFSQCRFFGNLDRYRFEGSLPEQFRYTAYDRYLHDRIYGPLSIPLDKIIMLDADAQDAAVACALFEKQIQERGGIDFQVLGLGPDPSPHVAFCLPGTPINSRTHEVVLDERTIIANSRDYMTDEDRRALELDKDEDPWFKMKSEWIDDPNHFKMNYFNKHVRPRVPQSALTMGIGTILDAKRLMMVVNKRSKARALFRMLFEIPRPEVPASFMRYHRDLTIIADEDAAFELPEPYNKIGRHKIGILAGQEG